MLLRYTAFACLTASAAALTALMPTVLLRASLKFQRTTNIQNAWEPLVDPANGYTYYYDAQTGQSQWEVPTEFATTVAAPNVAAKLVLWRMTGSAYRNSLNEPAGVGSFTGMTGFAGADKSRDYEIDKTQPVVYPLCEGDEQVLSRWNMVEQALTVSRRQCDIECKGGYATLVSNGRSPTMWRERGGPWCSVPKGGSLVLSDGDQVSLDAQDPDAAIFTCEAAQPGGSAQQGGYEQQGGSAQQGGYEQQGGYAQQGGYEQQGGYAQQGQTQLPYPWEQLADQNGAVYYTNPQTGESQWDPPQ